MSIENDVSSLLSDELQQLKQELVSSITQAGKSATGRTVNAIQVFASGKRGRLEAPSHLFTLETGRGPARGGSSDKQQFIENLKAWIVAKGIPYKDENDLQRLASFFRWYINKFGTKQYRSGGRNDIITPAIEKFLKSVNSKIPNLYSSKLSGILG